MGSRERRRAERQKRKARSAGRRVEETASEDTGAADTATEIGAESGIHAAAEVGATAERDAEPKPERPMQRGYARAEERNREAREALVPLQEGERPLVVTIGAVISALLSVSIVIGYVAGVKVDGERPEFVQVLAPALITGIMAWGMWRARYWAVLGFQTILLFLIFAAAFGLAVQAVSAAQILANVLLLAVAGTFFFFMIKALARIQMPHRMPRE